LRLREASTQGFTRAIVPKKPIEAQKGIKCYEVDEVSKLIEWM